MPSSTTSTVFYVYVLESKNTGERYIGYTTDLKRRLEEHRRGLSFSTKSILPIKLVYFEACTDINDAKRREKYFKTTGGRRFLAKRLKSYYQSKL